MLSCLLQGSESLCRVYREREGSQEGCGTLNSVIGAQHTNLQHNEGMLSQALRHSINEGYMEY